MAPSLLREAHRRPPPFRVRSFGSSGVDVNGGICYDYDPFVGPNDGEGPDDEDSDDYFEVHS